MTRLALFSMLLSVLTLVGAVMASPASAADKDCGDFKNQAAAQKFFLKHNPKADPHRLDADGDGIACESNPCPCNKKKGGKGKDNGGKGKGGKKGTLRQQAKVIRVIDGDTVKVKLNGGRKKSVRMIGLNTPERGQCGYATATNKLRKTLPRGTRVKLVSDSTQQRSDRYGRLLRYIIKRKTDASRKQIKRGMAKVYVYNYNPFKRVKKYRKSLRQAKAHNRGLWRNCW